MDLVKEGLIDEKTAIVRCEPQKLDELLHPIFDKKELAKAKPITQGLAASPGAACGQIVFFADDAEQWHNDGYKVVMVRIETSPEDLAGMSAAEGILTARGGMTSHAAVVARGMGKCCVSGAGAIVVDYKNRTVEIEGVKYKEGDFLSLNGSTGQVYAGQIPTKAAELSEDFKTLMDLCDKYTKLQVRTNADTPYDAQIARQFGAKGIGLTRTEHMFFEDKKIVAMREMILADTVEGREKALAKLLPYQKADFKGILKAMDGCPVNIRLLDPPLHEFVPHDLKGQETMAKEMGVSIEYIQRRVNSLAENNPMLGHRGCRLGITFPEITAMQTRAILSAACELKKEGFDPQPEIMVPLIGILYELTQQKEVIKKTAEESSASPHLTKLSIKKNMFAYDNPKPLQPASATSIDGHLYQCQPTDLEELFEMTCDFHKETNVPMSDKDEALKKIEQGIKDGLYYFWQNSEGKNVGCCIYRPNGQLASLGAVYTRPEYRRRNYAENLVYHVTKIAQDKGYLPMLYTDADYAASNACYEKIGYILRGKLCTIGI
jgi:pyruvate,phosphate dikinase